MSYSLWFSMDFLKTQDWWFQSKLVWKWPKSDSSAFSISVFLHLCCFLQLKFSPNVYIFKALSQSKLCSSFWQTWLLDSVNIDWESQLKKTTEMQKNRNTEKPFLSQIFLGAKRKWLLLAIRGMRGQLLEFKTHFAITTQHILYDFKWIFWIVYSKT